MSFLEDFGDLLTQTVTREPWASKDSHGQPSYGTATTHLCRMVYKPTLVRSTGGARSETQGSVREVVSSAQVWTAPIGWGAKDRITLPDGTTPAILDVKKYPDHQGDHHEVVMV